MPAIVSVEGLTCLTCFNDLRGEALKCSDCTGYCHLICSGMEAYPLVRFYLTQASFVCRTCMKAKAGEEEFEVKVTKVKETMLREREAMKEIANNESASILDLDLPNTEVNENSALIVDKTIGSGQQDIGHDMPSDSGNRIGNTSGEQENGVNASQTTVTSRNPNHQSVQDTARQHKNRPICKYYLMRECVHGRLGKECRFSHPKICINFAKNGDRRGGCKRDKNCKDYHPKLCFESLERRECRRHKCRYFHLNRTKSTYEAENRDIFNGNHSEANNRSGPSFASFAQITARNMPRTIENPSGNSYENRSNSYLNSNTLQTDGNQNFFEVDQRLKRLESMIATLIQTVRPPGVPVRLPEHH